MQEGAGKKPYGEETLRWSWGLGFVLGSLSEFQLLAVSGPLT